MTNLLQYTRAFARALVEHLRGNMPEFTEQKLGANGCSTCGYGASEYDVLDMDKLEIEIHKFTNKYDEDSPK